MSKKILVTGAAGFIGFHLSKRLLADGWIVVGLDSINDYYDVRLKYARLKALGVSKELITYGTLALSDPGTFARNNPGTLAINGLETLAGNDHSPNFSFIQLKLEDGAGLAGLFEQEQFDVVCNLAAQAGVRYSIENPMAYVNSNIVGFTNILEQSRLHKVEHLVYASSSSVYGLNGHMPFSTHESVNHPVSFYAATKKSNELMAHVFSKLYALPTTGLRFFTVYGPWGRPDMSPMLFADAILHGKTLKVFNNGDMGRDFTYINDIIEGVVRVINHPAEALPIAGTGDSAPSVAAGAAFSTADSNAINIGVPFPDTNEAEASADFPTWDPMAPDPASSCVPYRVYNIGSSSPVRLMDYIETLEQALGKQANKEFLPMQPGDVLNTYCDVSDLEKEFGYRPSTTLKQGLQAFADWYKWWDTQLKKG